jgi:serine/threonine protein kinase
MGEDVSTATKVQTDTWLRDALPRGTVLHGYEIVGILGRGGFGITYRAVDRIDQVFAIKECYPKQFVVRHGQDVLPAGDDDAEMVTNCLERFTKEARALTLFSKSGSAVDGVVKVITFFETNKTAYIVMEFLEGESLEALIAAHPEGLPEPRLVPIMQQLLTALACVHDNGLLHRDIKPANILLRRDGRPVLLDFGAARGFQSANPAASLAIFTEAYAPVEQIASQAQGPFSDLYSFGVTCYKAIASTRFRSAPTSTDRAARAMRDADPLVPAMTVGAGRYSEALLGSIDLLLRIKPEDRPQTVADFLPHFAACFRTAGPPIEAPTRIIDSDATRIQTHATTQSGGSVSEPSLPIGARAASGLPSGVLSAREPAATMVAMPGAETAVPRRSGLGVVLAGSVALILVLAAAISGAVYFYMKSVDPANQPPPMPIVTTPPSPSASDQPRSDAAPPDAAADTAPKPTEISEANQAYERKDYAQAARSYLAAANANNAQAQYQLGYMYQLGQGVAQDYATAAHWYELSAGQGYRDAQLQLGYLVQNGLGMAKSYPMALHWYQLAAAQGSVPAQNQLGYLYQMGYGVPVNFPEALRWYQSAAQQGSAPAQFRIGHFYAEGLGVARDLATARDWMTRAAAGGNADAKKWLAAH